MVSIESTSAPFAAVDSKLASIQSSSCDLRMFTMSGLRRSATVEIRADFRPYLS